MNKHKQKSTKTLNKTLSKRWLIIGIFSVCVITYETIIHYIEPKLLPIRHIKLDSPLQQVNPNAVQGPLHKYVRGFFTSNTMAIKEELQKVPFVDQVAIRRVWPDTLQISLIEQKIVALWSDQGVLTNRGEIIALRAQDIAGCPHFYGPNDQARIMLEEYQEIIALLSPLNLTVTEMNLNNRHSLQVTLNNEMRIILGRKEIGESLAKLHNILPRLQKRHGNHLDQIDFRHSNGVCVHLR